MTSRISANNKRLTTVKEHNMTQVLCKDCYTPFSVERFRLGYHTCLDCGDTAARKVVFTTAPINKSNYMLISNYAELAQLNPKRTA
jgi:ribosomal protein L37AE/L43A